MKREFIPYAEALALKELGFDEPCIAEYTDGGVFRVTYQKHDAFDLNDHEFNVFTNSHPNYFKSNPVSAPLYQQAFRWLMDHYGIYYNLHFNPLTKEWRISDISDFRDIDGTIFEGEEEFKSFEEAQLECLIEMIDIACTLNLII